MVQGDVASVVAQLAPGRIGRTEAIKAICVVIDGCCWHALSWLSNAGEFHRVESAALVALRAEPGRAGYGFH